MQSEGSQLRAANRGVLRTLYHGLLCSVGSPVAGVRQSKFARYLSIYMRVFYQGEKYVRL